MTGILLAIGISGVTGAAIGFMVGAIMGAQVNDSFEEIPLDDDKLA